jgi:hypothetical protein
MFSESQIRSIGEPKCVSSASFVSRVVPFGLFRLSLNSSFHPSWVSLHFYVLPVCDLRVLLGVSFFRPFLKYVHTNSKFNLIIEIFM